MDDPADLVGWPEGSAMVVTRGSPTTTTLAASGDLEVPRAWASVSKVVVSTAIARMVQRGEVSLSTPAGPPGSTLAHLLAHASGLGLERNDPTMAVGARRIYSNIGIDLAVATVTSDEQSGAWLHREVFGPLKMGLSELVGRPSSGVRGSLRDLATLGAAWLQPGDFTFEVGEFTSTFLPDLDGVVPGFGRFHPCPWGLGVEIHGDKHHWMGQRFSPQCFGHFGQSGSLLFVDPRNQLVVAACAGAPFGPWAQKLWPAWMDSVADNYAAA